MLAGQIKRTEAVATTEPVNTEGCCCGSERDSDGEQSTSSERPLPLPKDKCPCFERYAVLPVTPTLEQLDLAIVVALPLSQLMSPMAAVAEELAALVLHPPIQALHIVNCVWLC